MNGETRREAAQEARAAMHHTAELPGFAIRAATSPGELGECARIMAGSEPWLTLQRSPGVCLQLCSNPTKEVYLAVAGARILGFLILDLTGPFPGYLQTVCVAPEARGRGVGSQLIGFAEQRIFRDSPNVFLCVSSFNAAAQRLYERLGYETVGVLKGYLVAEHDEILLRKSLGAWRGFRGGAAAAKLEPPPAER
jgi:[ribosomal protein S18]-alanine N-acetyltransferase